MTPGGIRERLRAELIEEITTTARRHLAEQGAAGLSLRAVAREVGISPSAVYRYFPDRDALLTALIIQAYRSLGEAAAAAEAQMPREDWLRRWIAVFQAVRGWAAAHVHEYALIYGSPVPGYRAPQDTSVPAAQVVLVLAKIISDALEGPGLEPSPDAVELPAELAEDAEGRMVQLLQEYGEELGPLEGISAATLVSLIDSWTMLYGTVSFELFGHYQAVLDAREAHMDHVARMTARSIGLPGA